VTPNFSGEKNAQHTIFSTLNGPIPIYDDSLLKLFFLQNICRGNLEEESLRLNISMLLKGKKK
jgi:hypothetical protein